MLLSLGGEDESDSFSVFFVPHPARRKTEKRRRRDFFIRVIKKKVIFIISLSFLDNNSFFKNSLFRRKTLAIAFELCNDIKSF